MNALGFSTQDMMDSSFAPKLEETSSPSEDSPRRSPTPSLRIDTTNIPAFRPPASPRRASFSSETIYKSPDGMLCPPVMTHRRSKTLSVSPRTAFSMETPSSTVLQTPTTSQHNEVRSISTESRYGQSSGIMTSVLIPKVVDYSFERDLAAYSQTLSSVTASDNLSKAMKMPSVTKGKSVKKSSMSQSLEEDDLDVNAEFDFDAEFGDIIDISETTPPS